ncbi:MAG: type II secretion system protein [Phycisphaerae bacterium]|nr:type II secretion system protein [Phycisphaerae bacterium]
MKIEHLKATVKNEGFTLAEAMIALVILSIAAAGLLLPFASSAAVQEQGCNQTIAAKLASDLIEQIINTDFNQIVSTYGSYTELKGQVKNANGVVFSDPIYSDFSRQAVCGYIYVSQQQNTGTPCFVKITVRVFYNGLKLAEVVRLKSK